MNFFDSLDDKEKSIILTYKSVLDGTLPRFPSKFWSNDSKEKNAKICLKWLIDDYLKLSDEEIKSQYSVRFLMKYKLFNYLNPKGESAFNLINKVYPNKFKEWEFASVPRNFWTKEKAEEAIQWFIQKSLDSESKDNLKKITVTALKKNGLESITNSCYNINIREIVASLYADKYKPWELGRMPKTFWTDENIILATKWLIEEKCRYTREDIIKKLTLDVFKDNDLGGLLRLNKSLYDILELTYPGEFKQWELRCVGQIFWTKDKSIEATKWLVEEKLKIPMDVLPATIKNSMFLENKLEKPMRLYYNQSPYNAIEAAYPNKFKPWQFKKVPTGFWSEDTRIEAIRWLVEEKLNFTPTHAFSYIKRKHFHENGLGSLLSLRYGDNVKALILEAYPFLADSTKKTMEV